MIAFLIPFLIRTGIPARFAGAVAWVIIAVVAITVLVGAFFWVRTSDNDAVRAACNKQWEDAQAKAVEAANARTRAALAAVEAISKERDDLRAKAAVVETKIIERVRYEKGKDRVVYGGCIHTPGVRREIGELLRTVPSPGSDGQRGETVPSGAASP